MCGRYKLSTRGDELWESFDIHGEQQIKLQLAPHWNIAPTQQIWLGSILRRATGTCLSLTLILWSWWR